MKPAKTILTTSHVLRVPRPPRRLGALAGLGLLLPIAFTAPAATRTTSAATATRTSAATATSSASTTTTAAAASSGGTSSMPNLGSTSSTPNAGGLINAGAGTYQVYTTNQPVSLTINNGLKGLSEEVIPDLADPDHRYFGLQLFWDQYAIECLRIDAGMKNTNLDAPITASMINGTFGNNGKVLVDFDLNADLTTTFFVDVDTAPGFTACSLLAALDSVADWFVMTFGGEVNDVTNSRDIAFEQLTLSASGLTGEVNVTLGLVDDAVQVTSVDKLTAVIGDMDYSGTALVEFLTRLAEAGINLVYDDIEDFVNTELNDTVIPDQEERLQNIVNDALDQNLSVDSTIPLGGFNAQVKLDPAQLRTSKDANTLTLDFNYDITSSAPNAPGVTNVTFRGSLSGTAEKTSSDFDLQIPHWTIAKSISEAARLGLFSTTTLTPLSTQPWTVGPSGSISVVNGRSTITTNSPSGFPMSMELHRGELLITVPMLFGGKVGGYTGSASADLQIYVEPVIPETNRTVYLAVTELEAVNVTGSLTTAGGVTVNLDSVMNTFLNNAAEKLEDEIGKIPLLPKTTKFAPHLGLELGVVLINDSHTTVGVNIVRLPGNSDDGLNFEPVENFGAGDPHLDEDDLPPLNDGGPIDRIYP